MGIYYYCGHHWGGECSDNYYEWVYIIIVDTIGEGSVLITITNGYNLYIIIIDVFAVLILVIAVMSVCISLSVIIGLNVEMHMSGLV